MVPHTHTHTHISLFPSFSDYFLFFQSSSSSSKKIFWLCKKEINEHRHKHSASVYMYTHVWLTKKHRMHLIALFLNDLSLSFFYQCINFLKTFFLFLVQESSSTCSCRLQFFFWKNILSFTHLTSHHTKSSETTTKRREIFLEEHENEKKNSIGRMAFRKNFNRFCQIYQMPPQ